VRGPQERKVGKLPEIRHSSPISDDLATPEKIGFLHIELDPDIKPRIIDA